MGLLPAWPALLSWSPAPQGTEREPLPSISRPGGSTPLGTAAHPPGCGVTWRQGAGRGDTSTMGTQHSHAFRRLGRPAMTVLAYKNLRV